MSDEYLALAEHVITNGKTKITANVAITSIRRGLKKALDNLNFSRSVLELDSFDGRFAIKHCPATATSEAYFEIEYTTEAPQLSDAFTPKFQFKLLEDSDDGQT